MGLKSNQKAVGYYYNIHPSTAPMGISCHASNIVALRIHSWVRLLVIPPAAACITSSIMRASHQGGSLLVMTKACAIFSNRFLPSSSCGQPRVMAMACIVLGVSGATSGQELREKSAISGSVLFPLTACGFLSPA